MKSQPVNDLWVPAEGQAVDLGPPPNSEPGAIGRLNIVRCMTTSGPEQRSFWQPSPQDLAILANGGMVMLTINSGSHPPVNLAAFDPETRDPGFIEGFMCPCGGKVFRPFGVDDLMCTACGTMFTTRLDPDLDLELAGVVDLDVATDVGGDEEQLEDLRRRRTEGGE